MKSVRPSDRLSAKARFLNSQGDMFSSDLFQAETKTVLHRLAELSPAQQRKLVLAAPAFVAGERPADQGEGFDSIIDGRVNPYLVWCCNNRIAPSEGASLYRAWQKHPGASLWLRDLRARVLEAAK